MVRSGGVGAAARDADRGTRANRNRMHTIDEPLGQEHLLCSPSCQAGLRCVLDRDVRWFPNDNNSRRSHAVTGSGGIVSTHG